MLDDTVSLFFLPLPFCLVRCRRVQTFHSEIFDLKEVDVLLVVINLCSLKDRPQLPTLLDVPKDSKNLEIE